MQIDGGNGIPPGASPLGGHPDRSRRESESKLLPAGSQSGLESSQQQHSLPPPPLPQQQAALHSATGDSPRDAGGGKVVGKTEAAAADAGRVTSETEVDGVHASLADCESNVAKMHANAEVLQR